jgi:hypothetical protein
MAGENLVTEGMQGDSIYLIKKGPFVSQKTVNVANVNFWPLSVQKWISSKIERKVLFTANKMT